MEIYISKRSSILPSTGEIFYSNGKIHQSRNLEPLTMKLLEYLSSKKGEVCTSEEIIDHIWEGNNYVGREALRKKIYQLRSTLKNLGEKNIIQTIPKKGYRLEDFSSEQEFKMSMYNQKILIATFIITALFLIKIIFPGIIHRLMH